FAAFQRVDDGTRGRLRHAVLVLQGTQGTLDDRLNAVQIQQRNGRQAAVESEPLGMNCGGSLETQIGLVQVVHHECSAPANQLNARHSATNRADQGLLPACWLAPVPLDQRLVTAERTVDRAKRKKSLNQTALLPSKGDSRVPVQPATLDVKSIVWKQA